MARGPHAGTPTRGGAGTLRRRGAAPARGVPGAGAESCDVPSPGRPCRTRPGCNTVGSAGGGSPSLCPLQTAQRAGVKRSRPGLPSPLQPPGLPWSSPSLPGRSASALPTRHLGEQPGQHLGQVSAHVGVLTPAAGPVHLPGGLQAEHAWPEPTTDPRGSHGGPGTCSHVARSYPGGAPPKSRIKLWTTTRVFVSKAVLPTQGRRQELSRLPQGHTSGWDPYLLVRCHKTDINTQSWTCAQTRT